MKKSTPFLFALLAVAILISACSKKDSKVSLPPKLDTQKPTITGLMPSINDTTYSVMDTVRVEIRCQDDVALDRMVISLKHKAASLVTYVLWSWEKSYSISGTSTVSVFYIDIPVYYLAPAGGYQIEAYCVDRNGNKSGFYRNDVNIFNPTFNIQPTINIMAPDPVNPTNFSIASLVSMNGSASGAYNIEYVDVNIYHIQNNDTIFTSAHPSIGLPMYNYSDAFTIPANTPPGYYYVMVRALDGALNEVRDTSVININ